MGAIWAPGGVSIDTHGNVYVSTGNPDPTINGDFGESVLKFDGSPAMHLIGALKTFPGGDNDLSSVSPAQLRRTPAVPDRQATPGLARRHEHDEGACSRCPMCTGVDADGADAWDGSHLYVPCNDGIQQVNVDVAHRSMSLGWKGPGEGSPILAGGALWSIDWDSAQLYALEPRDRRGAAAGSRSRSTRRRTSRRRRPRSASC